MWKMLHVMAMLRVCFRRAVRMLALSLTGTYLYAIGYDWELIHDAVNSLSTDYHIISFANGVTLQILRSI